MTWEPQRVLWAGLSISLVSTVAALGAIVVGARRRSVVAWNPHRVVGFAPPRIEPTSIRSSAVLVMGASFIGWLLGGHLVGAIAFAVVLAASLLRNVRLVAIGGFALVAIAGCMVLVTEMRESFAAGFGWPAQFETSHAPALAGVLLVSIGAFTEGSDAGRRTRGARRVAGPDR